ncbi:PilW family protein [Xylophilus sp.]|uniref:PilW family protein n=1 Tax=Xylophilus sp. TaxID=2653893 RepID=UPI0013B7DEC8|nr:prepilin-type N-terminal cleavage/methylation domain-containing protein [Xylophilus sp.]KAF1046664.1 MAG: hypothetical protein GAK38_02400 [Xylophilus sp.]
MTMKHQPSHRTRSRGLTLVELLVAMALGLLLVLAAGSALLLARRGFATVDAASQLRDNARFATEIIQRLVAQAGFQDLLDAEVAYSVKAASTGTSESGVKTSSADLAPHVQGLNNRKRSAKQGPDESSPWGSSDLGANSDILVVRFQPATGACPKFCV